MWKTVLHRPHIGKSAARTHDGDRRSRSPTKEKQPCITLRGVAPHLLLCVDRIENPMPRRCVCRKPIHNCHGSRRRDVRIPCQAQTAERIAIHVPALYGKEQPTVRCKQECPCHILHAGLC